MMKWLRQLWQKLRERFVGRPEPVGFQVTKVEDLPDVLEQCRLYLVGEGEYLWSVAMLCPCGCGETLQMNTLPEARPRWEVEQHQDGTATLHPSVWRKVGCRSHFFLRRGMIQWCKDED